MSFFTRVRNIFSPCAEQKKSVSGLVKDLEYAEKYEKSLAEWMLYHQEEIIFDKVHWMGVPILKNVMDLWIYQELLFKIKPDFIIEIGSYLGGSALFFAHLCESMGKGEVLSVDVVHDRCKVEHPRIRKITGSSQDPGVITQVIEACGDGRVFIIQDGNHHEEHVLADLRAYADIVSKGSYFVVEDGIVDVFAKGTNIYDALSAPGPLGATRKFIEEDSRFIVDTDCERYLLTYNPKGFLKRVS